RRAGARSRDGRRRAPARARRVQSRALDRHRRAGLSGPRVRILQLVSCRGWSSDAYWAARVSHELERRGHQVTLGCRAGSEARVITQPRPLGVRRIETFAFASGVAPGADAGDVRRVVAKVAETDIVHVHRSKEHWLAAAANRLSRTSRPIVQIGRASCRESGEG